MRDLKPSDKKTVVVVMRKDTHQKAKMKARREGLSFSEMIRVLCDGVANGTLKVKTCIQK